MRETIQVDTITCEGCVGKVSRALAGVKGLNEARVELGTSSVIVDYDDGVEAAVDAALEGAGFSIVQRTPMPS